MILPLHWLQLGELLSSIALTEPAHHQQALHVIELKYYNDQEHASIQCLQFMGKNAIALHLSSKQTQSCL